jgi:proline iminopeptidase
MWGPSEFTASGNLKDWNREADIAGIAVPTLITCGRLDEATPDLAASMQRVITGSELVVFEDSSHMAMLEETDRYVGVLREFMRRAEAA